MVLARRRTTGSHLGLAFFGGRQPHESSLTYGVRPAIELTDRSDVPSGVQTLIKSIFVAIWVCAATVGGLYLTTVAGSSGQTGNHIEADPAELLRTKIVAVPVLADGRVLGYFLSRMHYAVADAPEAANLPFDALLRHALHAAVHQLSDLNFRDAEHVDKRQIEQTITDILNRRLGMPIVRDVVLEDIDFLLRSEGQS